MRDVWKFSDKGCYLLIRGNSANMRLGAELANIHNDELFFSYAPIISKRWNFIPKKAL